MITHVDAITYAKPKINVDAAGLCYLKRAQVGLVLL